MIRSPIARWHGVQVVPALESFPGGQKGFATDSSWSETDQDRCRRVALVPHRCQGTPFGSTILDPPSWKESEVHHLTVIHPTVHSTNSR